MSKIAKRKAQKFKKSKSPDFLSENARAFYGRKLKKLPIERAVSVRMKHFNSTIKPTITEIHYI